MIDLGPCEITSTFGPMCSGKTYLIQKWIENQNRYVRFDSTGETLSDPRIEHVWQNPKQLYERIMDNPYYFRVAYHPGTDIQTDFHWVVKCLWRLDVFKTIVCDEFHEVCNVNDTPKFVQTMMRYARHDHLAVIGASQRIADVHKLFTSGSRMVVIFWSQEYRDILAVKDRWGAEAAEMVTELRPLVHDDTTKVTTQVPQALVIRKGKPLAIYDFKTDSYVTEGDGRPRSEDFDEDDSNLSGNESIEDHGEDRREVVSEVSENGNVGAVAGGNEAQSNG